MARSRSLPSRPYGAAWSGACREAWLAPGSRTRSDRGGPGCPLLSGKAPTYPDFVEERRSVESASSLDGLISAFHGTSLQKPARGLGTGRPVPGLQRRTGVTVHSRTESAFCHVPKGTSFGVFSDRHFAHVNRQLVPEPSTCDGLMPARRTRESGADTDEVLFRGTISKVDRQPAWGPSRTSCRANVPMLE